MRHNYIGGEWVAGVSSRPNLNPSDLSDVIDHYAHGDEQQTLSAIAAAKAALPGWASSGIQSRADALEKVAAELLARREELGNLLAREEGKTLPEAVAEVNRAGQIFRFFAGEVLRASGEKLASVRPGIEVEITREPVGVVGLITPWNFPIAIPARKIAPALAHGNCVVFKPADLVPGSAWALAEIISRAGFPPGVFNLVMGPGSRVGQMLIDSPDIAAIASCAPQARGSHPMRSPGSRPAPDRSRSRTRASATRSRSGRRSSTGSPVWTATGWMPGPGARPSTPTSARVTTASKRWPPTRTACGASSPPQWSSISRRPSCRRSCSALPA
jgi:acyl-CoA reductase-like NAD-dependent aldehyde dehydrogenase